MTSFRRSNDLRKQLGDVAEKIDLDAIGLTERKKVLGVPVGKKQTDWGQLASYGLAAAVAFAGTRLLGRGKAKVAEKGRELTSAADDAKQRARETAEGAKDEAIAKASEAADEAQDAAETVGQRGHEAVEATRSKTSELTERGRDAAATAKAQGEELTERGRDAAATAKAKGEELTERGRDAAATAKAKGEELLGQEDGADTEDQDEHPTDQAPEGGTEAEEQDATDEERPTERASDDTGDQDAPDEERPPTERASGEEDTDSEGQVEERTEAEDGGAPARQRLIMQHQVDIAVPRAAVFDRWSRSVDLVGAPGAMQNVTQEDDAETAWRQILFAERKWDAEVVQLVPDQRIGWESSGEVEHRGVVSFHELAEDLTRVQIEMEYLPQGVVEDVAELFRQVRRRVEKDLRLFKHHLEFEAGATGAWRGQVGDDAESAEDDGDDGGDSSSDTDQDD
jgi:uncharacterized membrane protein